MYYQYQTQLISHQYVEDLNINNTIS